MKLKKTDYAVISILIVVVIAGIIGIVLAVNLMGENTQKEKERRNSLASNTNTVENETNETDENQIVNGVDTNATPEQQMQQLVNSIPGVLNGSNNTTSIKSIKLRYAYGYDVTMADQLHFVEVLEYECKDDELITLGKLIENNKLDANASDSPTTNTATYYNTQMVVDGNKALAFSDKNALYYHDEKTQYVVLNEDVLKKVAEIVNREAEKKVSTINAGDVKTATITNSNNASVTITDASELETICKLVSFVNLNGDVVDLSKEQVVYTVDLSNGIKIKVTTGGATGFVSNGSGQQKVKFMFNAETGLESIFKKYSN